MRFGLALALAGIWIPQPGGTTATLRGVSAVNSKTAWASGTKGAVLRTVNGGANWTAAVVPGAGSLDFRDIQAFSADVAVIMSAGPGAQSRVYRTSDGGRTWSLAAENKDEKGFWDAIAFWDDRRGLLLGDPVDGRFVVMRTEDGGATWSRAEAARMPPAGEGEGAFAASGTCITVRPNGRAWFATGGVNGGRVFRSTDWGRTWSVVQTPIRHDAASAGIFSIAFVDDRRGVAVGGEYQKSAEDRDNAIVTDDGGVTWALSKSRPGGYREAVAFMPGRGVLATGPGGTDISHDRGETWSPADPTGYHALSIAQDGSAWAVGDTGRIALLSSRVLENQ